MGMDPAVNALTHAFQLQELWHTEIFFLVKRVSWVLHQSAARNVTNVYKLVVVGTENEADFAGNRVCEWIVVGFCNHRRLDNRVLCLISGKRSLIGELSFLFFQFTLLHQLTLLFNLLLLLAGDRRICDLFGIFSWLVLRNGKARNKSEAAHERQGKEKTRFHGGKDGLKESKLLVKASSRQV